MKANDVDLIQRTLDGDQGAFTTLVNKYQKSVHALVWRKISDFHIAEEITQDVFLKVYKRLSTLKRPELFPGWLYVIATRDCVSWLRKKQLPTKSLDAMSTAELEEVCYAQYEANCGEETAIEHQRELVKRLLQKLPESERTVVTLYYLAEMKSEDISAFLGVSSNTIRSRLRRARERLEKEELMIQEVLGSFQIPTNLTENIMREIVKIKPISPSVSKPWLPWGLSFASTFLVLLMVGMGPRALSRFQQPYNLDATSEMTVELVDAPVVFELKRELDVRNRFGKSDAPGRGSGAGPKANAGLLAAAQVDTVERQETEPQWMPTRGPEGGGIKNLFVTSQKEVYAVGDTRLYRLADDNTGWTLINAALPFISHSTPMAEGKDTLYIATETNLLASTDRGVTLHFLGPRPRGRAIALLIPSRLRWSKDAQIEMYLVLADGVFRSTDAGGTWHAFNNGLVAPKIHAAVAIENALFLGTKHGLYRLNSGVWEKLSVAQAQSIDALAVAGDKIYISVPKQRDQKSGSLFASSDFGASWVDITPINLKLGMVPLTRRSPLTIGSGSVKLVAAGETLLGLGLGAGVLRSRDAGDTWEYLGIHKHALTLGIFPAVALDANTFFIGGNRPGRSTDGGNSWHLFAAGIAEPHILDLALVNNVLYAVTNKGIAKSIDGGNQWTQLDTNLRLPRNKPLGALKLSNMTVVADSLYVRTNQGGSTNCLLHLPPDADTLMHIEGMPVYVDPSHGKWLEQTIRTTGTIDLNDTDLARYQLGIEEAVVRTTGEFAISENTFYIEYERKLYRWTRGNPEWHDTGMHDVPVFRDFYATDGFQFAVSGKVIYLGKSDGGLFQSLDGGDTWKDITPDFPFRLNKAESQYQLVKKIPHFREIFFVGNTVYVSTKDGTAMSNDGENWHTLTDPKYTPIAIRQLAVDDTTLYGVSQTGVYQLNNRTGIWESITSEVLGQVTSIVVARNVLYMGTEHRGLLSLPLYGL
ncbi:sigma-70 family RNA polymerase sigma factor [Candidatus Poribacteria bacterium]|nr:sigma-70 family RNA polymerase sigma factor [Candidatus Poribacteria bacterium]MYA99813.1 sigma-70 family RNA polymerase sigma factor [Candidatus Poribacteria bacterium]